MLIADHETTIDGLRTLVSLQAAFVVVRCLHPLPLFVQKLTQTPGDLQVFAPQAGGKSGCPPLSALLDKKNAPVEGVSLSKQHVGSVRPALLIRLSGKGQQVFEGVRIDPAESSVQGEAAFTEDDSLRKTQQLAQAMQGHLESLVGHIAIRIRPECFGQPLCPDLGSAQGDQCLEQGQGLALRLAGIGYGFGVPV